MAKNKLCFSIGGANQFAGAPRNSEMIELRQHGRDNFSVRYGLQHKTGLTYGAAAKELGACIMHMQADAGLLDNREKGER